ncbi:MAG: hypothetical protein DKM50_03555 [Candidatus Margulisiibacteriota bacterium]|nr:MAG: hypothetical protein A2X43_12675 [Candidatus Margulisbacteria bacterium GWD2_39_127]OGI02841.1 MAG: hypothetical protein A2X42_02075 [Candidatus Margulisbacteria bacterium GWF2_38_17]OGI09622.1 MAG: hypothetical protein A2X41_04785 [Candidatus Margulisbacteria bacterium GWE2_39_32]PZM83054.1 MAG: hypothetical protein DKM50_03555 [Candidatus Margulisiibacteriota bacterium]HAR63672.1 hypothetical protein [Candidatus Margulisiibacteriota bacterium]
MNKKLLYLLLAALIITTNTTGYAAFFLDHGLDLKGMQYGGAYTANPEGSGALYWNVANLSFQNKTELYTAYSKLFSEVNDFSLLMNGNIRGIGSFGIAYYRSGVENISYTDNYGNPIGSGNFSFVNQAYYLGYSCNYNETQALGITAKGITQTAGTIGQKKYLSCDFGYKIKLSGTLALGILLQDVVSTSPKELYGIYRCGISYDLAVLKFNIDYLSHQLFKKTYINLGAGYEPFDFFKIRGGYNAYEKNCYLGISIIINELGFDYLTSEQELGIIQKFGLSIRI